MPERYWIDDVFWRVREKNGFAMLKKKKFQCESGLGKVRLSSLPGWVKEKNLKQVLGHPTLSFFIRALKIF